jgi:hypothetical protein
MAHEAAIAHPNRGIQNIGLIQEEFLGHFRVPISTSNNRELGSHGTYIGSEPGSL